jgi:GAF domain-containing protein/ActR/RegA family two-component response regulator
VDLERLCAAAVSIGGATDAPAIAEQALDVAGALLPLDAGAVYRVDSRRFHLVMLASRGIAAGDADLIREPPLAATRVADVVRTGKLAALEVADGLEAEAWLGRLASAGGAPTVLAVPIPVGGETWGLLAVVSRAVRAPDADQAMVLGALAHQVGLGVGRARLLAETHAKTRRLEALTRAAQMLSATLSADQVLQRVVDAAIDVLDSSIARLWLLEEDGQTLSLGAQAGMAAVERSRVPVGTGLVGTIVATRAPLAITDVLADPRTRDTNLLRAEGIVSFAGVPLRVGDRVLGALGVGVREPREYSEADLSLLQSLAAQAAIALDNARLFGDEQTRRAYLAAVLEINKKIAALAPTSTLLTSIAEEAARLLDVDNAGFRLLDGEDLVLAGMAGMADQTMLRRRIRVGESFSGQVFAEGRTLLVSDADAYDGMAPEHRAAERRLGYTTYLGVPLQVAGRTIGVFVFRGRRPFTQRDQELAEAFAGQAAIAIEHARLFADTSRQAERMRALAEIGRLFSGTLDPDVVAQQIADSVRRLFSAVSSTLFRVDAVSGPLVALARAGGRGGKPEIVFPRDNGVAGMVVRERRPVASRDVLADPRVTFSPEVRRFIETAGHRAALAVPLLVNGVVIGVLSVGDHAGRVFDDEEVRLAEAFADQAALALTNARLYAEATRRREEAEHLARLAQTLTESLDVTAVVERTVESVLPLFGARSSVVRLLQPDGSLVALAVGGHDRERFGSGDVIPPGPSVLARAAAEGRPVSASDAVDEGSVLAVPMRAKGMIIGALGISDAPGRVFSAEETALLQAFADQATLALENARLFSTEQARRRHIASLAEIERELAAELDRERLLTLIVDRAAALFDAAGAVYLLEDGRLAPRVSSTASDVEVRSLEPGEGLVGAVGEERRGRIVNDYPRYEFALPALVDRGMRHVMAQPLLVRDRLLGVIAVGRRGADAMPFLGEDLELLESFAGHAATAIENAGLYAAIEIRAGRLRTLARLNRLVTSSLDTEHVLAAIARAAVEIISAPFVAFWVADEARRTLRIAATSTDVSDSGSPAPGIGQGAIDWVAEHQQPLSIPDVFVDARFNAPEWAHAHGFRSFFATPIVHQGELLGVLGLVADRPFRFSSDDDDLLQSFSAQAAVAIGNARRFQEARAYAERLRAVDEVNRLVSSSLNPEEVLRILAGAVGQFFDAPYASIWIHDPVAGRVRRAATSGDPEIAAAFLEDLAVGQGGVGWVVEHREPIIWTDVTDDPRMLNTAAMLRHGLHMFTAYPITVGDRVLGAFAVNRRDPWAMTPQTASLMGSLASQAAIALENARLYSETTRRLAETRALLEIAEILNSTLDSRQLLKRVTRRIAQVCGVERCSLQLWDGDRVIPLMAQFADGHKDLGMFARFMTDPSVPRDVPAHARAISTRQPVIIEDTALSDDIPREWTATFGMRSYMVVPLIRQEQVIGVMNLDDCSRVTRFEPWQQDVAQAIAGQLALALENTRLYAAAQERLRETTTLLAVGRILSQPGSTEELMRRVCAEVARAFEADMIGAYLLDEAREELRPIAGYRVPPELLSILLQRPARLDRFSNLRETWLAGRATWSADGLNDPRFDREWIAGLPPFSVLFAPTVAHGEPVGGLFLVWWRTGRAFAPAEIRLVEGVAAQVGLALENAELSRQTQLKLAETETLLSVSRTLSTTLDFSRLIRHFLRAVAGALGADSVGAWLVAEGGEWLEPLAGYRIPAERLERLRTMRISLREHSFYAEAARSKRPVVSSDVMRDPRVPRQIAEADPHTSQMFVPIIANDRIIGAFAAVWWDRVREFTERDITLIEAIANQAGVALDNARLFQENRRRVDELSVLHDLSREVTGQLDRGAVIEAIHRQVARVLDVRNMLIVLRDEENGDLEVALRNVDGVPDMSPPLRRRPGKAGLTSPLLDEGRAIRTDDYTAECARRGTQPVATSAALRHWLGVPMVAGGRVLGGLVLRGGERPFTEADEHLLGNIAHLAALALAGGRLFEERTRAFGELAAAQDQLVRTEKLRALGEMASGVAHDFNNLLASVLGRAQLLLRRVQEPQLRQWLEVIERSALDGAQTVKRLQQFTRIRRDEPFVQLDLNTVVREALEITQSRWREEPTSRGIHIELRTSFAPLPPVLGDAAELREAMTNIILNAVDAMPEGGTLCITTGCADERIEVTVQDTGTGMTDAVREKIFDPFFTTKGPEGTGLGLSMTYGIISRHGGSISVDSREGAGSTFHLAFHRAPATAAPAATASAEARPARSLRCLVVDDEEPVRSVLGDILASAGHTVVMLGDGAEAIERFRREPFDLVLTDLAMPRVSGWQVARAIKESAPSVPVFLVTGFGVELSAEERHSHSIDQILVKPLQIQDILDAVAGVARALPAAG